MLAKGETSMEKSRKERNEELAVLWKNHLDNWSFSGLTQSEYCRRNDLSRDRFSYWKRKFARQNLPVEFVQINTEPLNLVHSGLKLNIGAGLQIEIPDGFSRATLEKILITLKVL